jgi:hypothetical protein
MKKFILGGLAGVVLGAAVVTLLVPRDVKVDQTGRDLKIGIYLDPDAKNRCIVDFSDANVRRRRKDRVQWDSLDGPYSVWMTPSPGKTNTPPGTPFLDSSGHPASIFNIGANGSKNAGITYVSGDFYYEIYIGDYNTTNPPPASALCADPGLHVKD